MRLTCALLLAAMSSVQAQERERCLLNHTDSTTLYQEKTPSGQSNIFMGRGVRISCPTKDIRIKADSLESYGDDARIYLIGHVDYQEPRLVLTSEFLTYFQREERIVANGSVHATLPSGSTMRGPFAEYYRAIPQTRPFTRMFANGRPTFNVVQKDSSGRTPDTLEVVANNVTMLGDSLVYAGGQVQATRPDIEARGDSMTLDSEAERMVMMRTPVIAGRGQRPFTLAGDRIEATSKLRKLERVLSIGHAKAVSDSMTLTSDTLDLRVANDLLQRAVAWGPSRARAQSATQRLVADSIDVAMPGQRIREMHALRGATAEGRPDTTRFRADTTDWLRGDTVVARFDSATHADSNPRLRELVARGKARAYYHLNPTDTATHRAAINYVTGKEIVIAFQNQQVSRVTVIDQAAGVYLEPRVEPTRTDSTSTKAGVVPARGAPAASQGPRPRPPQ